MPHTVAPDAGLPLQTILSCGPAPQAATDVHDGSLSREGLFRWDPLHQTTRPASQTRAQYDRPVFCPDDIQNQCPQNNHAAV